MKPRSARLTLAENLRRLMAQRPKLNSQPRVAARAGIGQTTVGRILRGEVDTSVQHLEAIAEAFDLAPWQLLVPDLDPGNAPVLRVASQHEEELYGRLRLAAEELAQYRRTKE